MSKRPEIMIVGGAEDGRRFEVKLGGIRLGRSSSNDIHVRDEELSRNHCFFEPVGETGIRLTDLASANGTFVNHKALGSDPVMLNEGDLISVGQTTLRVVGEAKAAVPTSVNLGLGEEAKEGAAETSGTDKAKAPKGAATPVHVKRIRLVIGALAAVAALAVAGLFLAPTGETQEQVKGVEEVASADPQLRELTYEKVYANSKGVFRYELTLTADGVLKVVVDDVPAENRHLTKGQTLDDAARAELGDILKLSRLRELDRDYIGVPPDPPALESWSLRVVYDSLVRSVRVENTTEPEAFREIREKLEAFSKNQLGVWALQYSRDKLIELAKSSTELGDTKWNDRDVRYGNIYEAVQAYKEAIFYLETVNPKPDCFATARKGLETATGELEKRYKDQRFLADRAINLAQWDTAQRELHVLVEMIPDRRDPRSREASAKLIDVEKRLKGGQK